jgi:hypothetical protein
MNCGDLEDFLNAFMDCEVFGVRVQLKTWEATSDQEKRKAMSLGLHVFEVW